MSTKTTETQKITPFLWFDSNAEEASAFYTTVFKNSSINNITRYTESGSKAAGRPAGTVMTISFTLDGQEFVALNGGPVFEINPSISFYVNCGTRDEVNRLWDKLSKNGAVLMPLDSYPFSERFGWLMDRFGVTWQINLASGRQIITPSLLFVGEQDGKAEEAMNFYISLFRNSGIIHLEYNKEGDLGGSPDTLKLGRFFLSNQEFMVMDSNLNHPFSFTPAISFVVNCKTQEEIDFFWDQLSEGGPESAKQCGWLQDKYGVSWQVVPEFWQDMINKADDAKADKLMSAVLGMKKIEIDTIMEVNKS